MNAPAPRLIEMELIPCKSICVSETQAQAERRGRYDPAALDELTASIKSDGLLQPIVIRPLGALRGLAKYELVAGERRWLATQRAGLEHILARVLPLSDAQVLKAQMVENLHREGLHPLAEAKGFRELIAGGVKADAIGDLIGKSRSYVYARIKLLELAPAVQAALESGEILVDQALLFARIAPKLQELGLKTLRNWNYQGHGERLSFRRTAEILRDKGKAMLIPLAQVPFALDDTTYFTFGPKDSRGHQEAIALPACVSCPQRSGNDTELLAAIGDANVCTNKECHDIKAKEAIARRRKQAEAEGKEILSGDAAAAITPTDFGTRGYIDLDEPCDADEFPEPEPKQGKDESDEAFDQRYSDWDHRAAMYEPRSYRRILGELVHKLELKLVQDPRNKTRLRELAPDKAVAALLKKNGITLHVHRDTRKATKPPKPTRPEDPAKAAARREKEAAKQAAAQLEDQIAAKTKVKLLHAVFGKWKGPLHRDELEAIAEHLLENTGRSNSFETLYPKGARPATLADRELSKLALFTVICDDLDSWRRNDDRALKALAKRLKVDARAIEKAVRAELTPKVQGEGKTKKPATKKGKK